MPATSSIWTTPVKMLQWLHVQTTSSPRAQSLSARQVTTAPLQWRPTMASILHITTSMQVLTGCRMVVTLRDSRTRRVRWQTSHSQNLQQVKMCLELTKMYLVCCHGMVYVVSEMITAITKTVIWFSRQTVATTMVLLLLSLTTTSHQHSSLKRLRLQQLSQSQSQSLSSLSSLSSLRIRLFTASQRPDSPQVIWWARQNLHLLPSRTCQRPITIGLLATQVQFLTVLQNSAM